jgi:hypothetical protein
MLLYGRLKPAEVAAGPRPAEVAADSRPAEVAAGSRPAEVAAGSRPAEVAADSRPAEVAADSRPAEVAAGSRPAEVECPESEPAPQAAPGSASEHDQRAPLLPYGIRRKYDIVDVGASSDTVGER